MNDWRSGVISASLSYKRKIYKRDTRQWKGVFRALQIKEALRYAQDKNKP
ncbi:hypothetical protein [Bulleidia sp. zg-1006]|nr:hypothetical protein [Bulleidia sp. zg-1006]